MIYRALRLNFKEQWISDSAVQREDFEKSKIDFLDALVTNLNSRFLAADTTLPIFFQSRPSKVAW